MPPKNSRNKKFKREDPSKAFPQTEIPRRKILGYHRIFSADLDWKTLRRKIVKRVDVGRFRSFRIQDQEKSKERVPNRKFQPLKFGELVKGIRTSKKMVKLKLKFKDFLDIVKINKLPQLFSGLKRLGLLRYIDLDFTDWSGANKKVLWMLYDGFQCLHLKGLALSFAQINGISDYEFWTLRKGLRKIKHLKNLSIKFNYCRRIKDSGLIILNKYFNRNRSLQNLVLDFERCHFIQKTGLPDLCESLKKISTLKNLYLGFAWLVFFYDNALKTLLRSLHWLNSIENFGIDFLRCPFSNGGVQAILNRLIEIGPLKTKSLGLALGEIEKEKQIEGILESLGEFTALTRLRFAICSGNDLSLSHFLLKQFRKVLKKLTSLKSLSFDFQYFSGLDDSALLSLAGEPTSSLKYLENISIAFPEAYQPLIVDKELNGLCGFLRKITSLKTASFDLHGDFSRSDIGKNLKKDLPLVAISLKRRSQEELL